MGNTNLVTSSSLQEIKVSELEIVNNLSIHANTSLSKAHGWVFLNLPSPYLDSGGNDVSFYADSNGDIVGHYMLRLTYNNTNYYAPMESSILAGQDATTGLTIAEISTAGVIGGTAWITEFVSEVQSVIQSANSTVLLPHTRLGHWETHTGSIYAVIPQVTYDSSGHTVGNYIARISFNGQELWIPCDSRLGGPLQLPRLSGFSVISPIYLESGGGDTAPYNTPFFPVLLGGTLPITYSYEGPGTASPALIPAIQCQWE